MELSGKKVALAGSVRRPLPGAQIIADADPEQRIDVTVYVRRQPEAPPLPPVEELAMIPPNQRGFPSDEELTESYGASEEDLDAVAEFAREHDLEVLEASQLKRSVSLAGTVASFNRAFDVKLQQWAHERGDYRGREGHLYVPVELRNIVESVVGTDNRVIGRSYRQPARNPVFMRAPLPPQPFLPTRIAQLYNFPTQFDGTGQCIAILAFNGQVADTGISAPGGYDPDVLHHYFQNVVQVKVPEIVDVVVHGPGNEPGDGTNEADTSGEIMLDIQMADSIAPGAKIVVYFTEFTEQGWVDALHTVAIDTENNPSIISISYGNVETLKSAGNVDQRGSLWTVGAINQANRAFQFAGRKNITICCASGDDGSRDDADSLAHVDFPSSSPYVLGCGGTRLVSSGGVISSESVWNDGPGSAGGGGISDLFTVPRWQQNARIPPSVNPGHRISRGVPDVSGLADPQTGAIVADNNGHLEPIGGTSATAPLWAGLIARLNQALGARLGFMNPLLYTHFATGVLRDISVGNNGRYRAGIGWDPCTGLGSPDGMRLLQAFSGAGISHAISEPTAPIERIEALADRVRQLELEIRALQLGHSSSF